MHGNLVRLVAVVAIVAQVDLAFTSARTIVQRSLLTASSISTEQAEATYFWPLVGLNADASVPWGLNVSVSTGTESFASVYGLSIGDPPLGSTASEEKLGSSSASENPQVTATSKVLQQNNGEISAINIVNDGTPQVFLGPNANYSDTNSSNIVPTTPFGINLGQAGVWNGSLTLSGSFDVNRIASKSWMQLRTSGDGGYFSESGSRNTSGTIQWMGSSTDAEFALDFNSEAIVLPVSANTSDGMGRSPCGNDMTITINGGDANIIIPGNITSSPDRCYTRNSSNPGFQTTVLGQPFLQAAYAYFDRDGSIWVTQANQYDLPVNPQPFDPNAALAPPSPPESWKLAHPDWDNILTTPSGISQYLACLAGFGFLMFVFVALCNGILL
ncbi:MAG: hypothetical protein Q9165_007893 [Trypethelium subeluteriae]